MGGVNYSQALDDLNEDIISTLSDADVTGEDVASEDEVDGDEKTATASNITDAQDDEQNKECEDEQVSTTSILESNIENEDLSDNESNESTCSEIATSSIITEYSIVNDIDDVSDCDIASSSFTNIQTSTESFLIKEDELFGAPIEYTLPNNWYNSITGIDRATIKNISFEKFPTVAPTTYVQKTTIPNSNGLELYVTQNGSDHNITIYAPTNDEIYTAVDASNTFSSLTNGYSTLYNPVGNDYKNVKNINNLSYLNTSRTTNMSFMFYDCSSLTSLDVSNFDTSNVTNMDGMFRQCYGLTNLDLSNFNTSNVTSMMFMFYDCYSLVNLNLNGLNTSNVSNMGYMFGGGIFSIMNFTNLDLSSFDTSDVSNTTRMFYNCQSLVKILVSNNFTTAKITQSDDMFYNCSSLKGSQGTTLASVSNVTNHTYALIDGGTTNPGLFSAPPTPVLQSFIIITPPKKTVYKSGDTFDPTGLIIRASYSDSTSVDIDYNTHKSDFSFNPTIINASGDIMVTYSGLSANIRVTITSNTNDNTDNSNNNNDSSNNNSNNNTSSSHSSPGGSGGAGGGAGSTIKTNAITLVLMSPIQQNDVLWSIDNSTNQKNGIKINRTSSTAMALINNQEIGNAMYIDNKDPSYIQLKGGFFNVNGYYYAFNQTGEMLTGFVETVDNTSLFNIDLANNALVKVGQKEKSTYYLHESADEYRGIIWTQPEVINGTLYSFDEQGRVISSTPVSNLNTQATNTNASTFLQNTLERITTTLPKNPETFYKNLFQNIAISNKK